MRVRIGCRQAAAGAAVVVALLAPIAVAAAGGTRPPRDTAPLCRAARDPRIGARPAPPPPRRGSVAVHDSATDPVCVFANARQYRPPDQREQSLRRPGHFAVRRWADRHRTGRIARFLCLARTRVTTRHRAPTSPAALGHEREEAAPTPPPDPDTAS